jgi:hypothetical protein
VRIPVGIEPDTDGVGGADEVAIHDLQAARVTGVRRVIAHVKVAVHATNDAAELAWNGTSLFGNHAHP